MIRRFFSGFLLLVAGSLFSFMSIETFAQSALGSAASQADQIQRDRAAQERLRQLDELRLNNRPPEGRAPERPVLEIAVGKERCIQVDEITVTGIKLFTNDAVRTTLTPFEGRCLNITELNNVLKQLTFLYVAKGYITSRAFLPEQDLSDGSLEIVVVEGSLEKITLDGKAGAFKGQSATAFPGLKGKPVNLRDIEQGLDQLNRLRSNNATIELEAGEEFGASVLSVKRNKTKRWHASAGANNLGTQATGIYQSRVDLGLDDLLGLNDAWTFGYQRSSDTHPFKFSQTPKSNTFTGSFSIPYGYWTVSLNASHSAYDSTIARLFSDIETSGDSQSVNLNVSRVLQRDQVSITSLSGKLGWKSTDNFILGSLVDVSSRNLSIASVEFLHSRQLLGGQLVSSLQYNQGLDILGAFDDDSAPSGSPEGQFNAVEFSLNYFRPFKIGKINATFNESLSGQWSPDLLFGSEQVAYGDYFTVRGVRESVLFGNSGLLSRNELAVQLPRFKSRLLETMLGQVELYGAVDFGIILEEEALQIAGGNLTGGTIALRNRGGHLSFDLSYSDILASSNSLDLSATDRGLINFRASLSL